MNATEESEFPDKYVVGQDLDWKAPWVKVNVWVELPFWLMVNDSTIAVEVNGHEFQTEVHDEYFELNIGEIADSRSSVCYQGPLKTDDELGVKIQQVKAGHPGVPFMWRDVVPIDRRDRTAEANEYRRQCG